jgi:hypothetical protein
MALAMHPVPEPRRLMTSQLDGRAGRAFSTTALGGVLTCSDVPAAAHTCSAVAATQRAAGSGRGLLPTSALLANGERSISSSGGSSRHPAAAAAAAAGALAWTAAIDAHQSTTACMRHIYMPTQSERETTPSLRTAYYGCWLDSRCLDLVSGGRLLLLLAQG